MKTVRTQPPFRKLVGNGQFGGDPSKGTHPHSSGTSRYAFDSQQFDFSDNTRSTGMTTGAVAAATGTATVQNTGAGNCNLSTGLVYLTLGDGRYDIASIPSVLALPAYPSPTVANLAVAWATFINNLPGFTGAHIGGGVINITGPSGLGSAFVPFTVEHHGTLVNLVIAPITGFMTVGGPTFGPPTIT